MQIPGSYYRCIHIFSINYWANKALLGLFFFFDVSFQFKIMMLAYMVDLVSAVI